MTSTRNQSLYSLMRSAGLILVVLAGSGLLAGSSCHRRNDDDDCDFYDDDDCHHDDDDGGFIIHIGPVLEPNNPADPFRLNLFELVPAERDGDHPVAKVTAIGGISAFELTGLVELEAHDYEQLAVQIRNANRDLLAPAPGTGSLVHLETSMDADGVAVQFAQQGKDGAFLTGRGQRFHFAPFGELLEIENNLCERECE